MFDIWAEGVGTLCHLVHPPLGFMVVDIVVARYIWVVNYSTSYFEVLVSQHTRQISELCSVATTLSRKPQGVPLATNQ